MCDSPGRLRRRQFRRTDLAQKFKSVRYLLRNSVSSIHSHASVTSNYRASASHRLLAGRCQLTAIRPGRPPTYAAAGGE